MSSYISRVICWPLPAACSASSRISDGRATARLRGLVVVPALASQNHSAFSCAGVNAWKKPKLTIGTPSSAAASSSRWLYARYSLPCSGSITLRREVEIAGMVSPASASTLWKSASRPG